MAKKQLPSERNGNPNTNSKTPAKSKPRTKNSPKTIVNSTNNKRSRIAEIANGATSSEDTEPAAVPSSSVESESGEAEDGGVEQRSSSDDDEEEGEEEEEEEEEVEEEEEEEPEEKPKIDKKSGKKVDAKSNGKKRSRNGEAKEKSESALYTFPMNRISRIVKSEELDVRIMQEAVFVINKASEKFLQVFCKEAYARAFLNKKKQISYDHLSSVVSKRKRFQFLSDIVPEKVKAEDALALAGAAEDEK